MNQSELFDLIVEKSNQIAQLDGELSGAEEDIKELNIKTSSIDIAVNNLEYDKNNIIYRQHDIADRLESLEKKVDVLCSHFSFLFTQLDKQQV